MNNMCFLTRGTECDDFTSVEADSELIQREYWENEGDTRGLKRAYVGVFVRNDAWRHN